MENSQKGNITLPDELSILVNTSVPSLGKFYYNPKMSITDYTLLGKGKIFFNSYGKFSTTALDNIPVYEQRVSQLLLSDNYSGPVHKNTSPTTDNLNKTHIDIINSNTEFILNTIFKTGAPIKIKNNSYFITTYEIVSKNIKIVPKFENIYEDTSSYSTEHIARLHSEGNNTIEAISNLHKEDDVNLMSSMNSVKNKLNSTVKSIVDRAKTQFNKLKHDGGSSVKDRDDIFTVNLSSNVLITDIDFIISNIINNHNSTIQTIPERVTYALYNENGVILGHNDNFTKKSICRIATHNIKDYNDLYGNIETNKLSVEDHNLLKCLKWITIINEKLQIDLPVVYDESKNLLCFKGNLENKTLIQHGGSKDDKTNNKDKGNKNKENKEETDIEAFRDNLTKLLSKDKDIKKKNYKKESLHKYEIEIFIGLSAVNEGIECENKMHKLRYSFNKLFGRDNIKTNDLYNKRLNYSQKIN